MEPTEGPRARRAVPSRATERRAWGGAVGPRGRSVYGRSCSRAFTSDEAPAQRRAFEVDAMGAMDDAVENGVSQGGITDDFMPAIDRDLAGDQQRPPVVTVVDDLEQIAALLGIERFRPPIVDDQQAGAFERGHQPRQPAFAARLGEIGEHARGALVEHRKALAAGFVAERASQPRLADTGRADEAKMMMLADPLTARELEEESTVEAAVGAEVDVLDDGRLAQPGLAQAAGEPLGLAAGGLPG